METDKYIGNKYGRLTVISKSQDKKSQSGKTTYRMYLCQCDCGNMVEVMIGHLISGHTKSCGCLKNKWNVKNKRLFNCWWNMKQRCESSGRRDSKYYHDKGIGYCEAWKDYNKFQEWALSNGYDDDLTLDRIDSSKNYCPENCRWATAQEQQRNKQNCRIYTHNNKTQTLSEWAMEYNIPFQTLASRIDKLGYTFEDALKKPYGYQKTNVFLVFNGKTYTEAEFARFIGYTNSGVSRLVRLGYSAEQIYQNSIEYKKKKQCKEKEDKKLSDSMYIKVKFLKNNEPHGREYTYKATFPVRVGQEVILPGGGNGVVTEINVTEESVESFKDRIKEIESVVEESKQ